MNLTTVLALWSYDSLLPGPLMIAFVPGINWEREIAVFLAGFFLIVCVLFAVISAVFCQLRRDRHAQLRAPEALLFDVKLKPVSTKDKITILADMLISAEIIDPKKYAHDDIKNGAISTGQTIESLLERFWGSCEFERCLGKQDELCKRIKYDLGKVLVEQNIAVMQVQIKSIMQCQDDQKVFVRRGCVVKEVIADGKFSKKTGIPKGIFAFSCAIAALLVGLLLGIGISFGILFLHGIAFAVTYFGAKKRIIPESNGTGQKPDVNAIIWEKLMKTWAMYFVLWLFFLFGVSTLVLFMGDSGIAVVGVFIAVAGLITFIPTVVLTYLITFRK